MSFRDEFCSAWVAVRDRWFSHRQMMYFAGLLLAMLLCCHPATVDLALSIVNLGLDTVLLMIDVQFAVMLGMLLASLTALWRWRPSWRLR